MSQTIARTRVAQVVCSPFQGWFLPSGALMTQVINANPSFPIGFQPFGGHPR